MKTMPIRPEYLRASTTGRPVAVDRKADVLRGYVVAQEGLFKSDGRGQFDLQSLKEIVSLGNAARGGLKSRFTHPDMSSDGLGKHLGRARDFSLSTTKNRDGEIVKAVRADLHFDKTAHNTPTGDLAGYVMDLAESDPEAISSSIVVVVDRFISDGKDGLVKLEDHEDPPRGVTPLWRPRELHASDIVDTGDAVDGLLSAPQLAQALSVGLTPELQKLLRWDNVARLSSQLLDGLFAGQSREVVEARCREYLNRYLSRRFGESLQMMGGEMFMIGDRVRIRPGAEHEPEQAGMVGTVRLQGGMALGIQFDTTEPDDPMSNGIHRWYTSDELEPEISDGSGDGMGDMPMMKPTPRINKHSIRLREMQLVIDKLRKPVV